MLGGKAIPPFPHANLVTQPVFAGVYIPARRQDKPKYFLY